MMTAIAILLLAAGASARMRGQDKLRQPVDGQPLLSLLCDRARQTGFATYVTLPGHDHPRAAFIGSAHPVAVPDAAEGMAASIRRGVAALPEATEGVMILPADMPEITTEDILRVASGFQGGNGEILRASASDGRPGHPVLFPRRCFAALQDLRGDLGARALLRRDTVRPVALPGTHALTDLDTPEDWESWRRSR